MQTTACPKCKSTIQVSVIDLVPSMYPHNLDCDECGARSRMAYPWTFSAHFFMVVLGAVIAVKVIGLQSPMPVLLGAFGATYLFGSMALNWWYFKLGKPLVT